MELDRDVCVSSIVHAEIRFMRREYCSRVLRGENVRKNIQFLIRIQLSAQNEQLQNDKKKLNYSTG